MGWLMNALEKRLMPVAGRLAEQRHLQAIRDGIILAMPLLIIGSTFLIIAFLPIPGYSEAMSRLFGEQWQEKLLYPVSATYDIMAIVASFGIAYRLAEKYKVDPVAAGALAVAAFMLATPFKVPFTPPGSIEAIDVSGAIPVQWTGSRGLFVAMILAVLSTEIFRTIVQRDIVIRLPEGVPPAVSRSFVALIPGFVVLLVVWLIRLGVELTRFESVHNVVAKVLAGPLSSLSSSLPGALGAVLVAQLLWSVGIHGQAIVEGVLSPVWLALMDENRQVFQSNPTADLPHVVTLQFFQLWIQVGGSGTTLALVLLMLWRARSQHLRNLGRLALGPGIFNINEPVTFGLPIVMNPLLIVPFIIAPLVVTLISYLAMDWNLVAKPSGVAVPWTTPFIISGYLATGGRISGAVLQVVNLIVAGLIYYPFLRLWDQQKVEEEQAAEIETGGGTSIAGQASTSMRT